MSLDIVSILWNLIYGMNDILIAPFKNLSMLWQLLPLTIIWITLNIYFETHKKETLGWNTALGNAITLFWVAVTNMQYIFTNYQQIILKPAGLNFYGRFAINVIIISYAVGIAYISFAHKFSSKITFTLSSVNIESFIAVCSILLSYGLLKLDWIILVDLMILFGFVLIINKIFYKILPELKEEDENSIDKSSFDNDNSTDKLDLESNNEQYNNNQNEFDKNNIMELKVNNNSNLNNINNNFVNKTNNKITDYDYDKEY